MLNLLTFAPVLAATSSPDQSTPALVGGAVTMALMFCAVSAKDEGKTLFFVLMIAWVIGFCALVSFAAWVAGTLAWIAIALFICILVRPILSAIAGIFE